jgi:hypothetical protein
VGAFPGTKEFPRADSAKISAPVSSKPEHPSKVAVFSKRVIFFNLRSLKSVHK